MKVKNATPLLKFIAPLLLFCAYSSPSIASPDECINSLFDYGDTFPVEKLGAKVSVKIVQEPSKYYGGGNIDVSTYSSGENTIMTRGCVSCQPKEESRAETYLIVNEPLACGIKKGLTVSQITRILGKPHEEQGSENNKYLFYYTSIEQNNLVAIEIVDGKMKGLLNSYYY